jgi:hypothetical protein
MRYQIRLLDQNLPGLARELSLDAWRAVDGLTRARAGDAVYRAIGRAVRGLLKERVKAFRYCGAAGVCCGSIPGATLALEPAHEAFAGEHVHIYLMEGDDAPAELQHELVTRTMKAAARALPGRPMKGLSEALKTAFARRLDGHVFRSTRCGDSPLCHANEEYDPWDLRDPINAVRGGAR